MDLMLPFIAAMAISMSVIPMMVRFAPALGMLDAPDPRKVHATPIPRVGGIGIVLGALIPLALWLPADKTLVAYFAGSLILLMFGVWDDVRELGHYPKFIGQILAVVAVVYYGDVYVKTLPFMGLQPIAPVVGRPFTVFAMVGLINAINHSDGLDGLAGGESLLSFGCIAYLAHAAGGNGLVTIAVATVGGVFGFLRFNSHPARVFMGDGGSQFLGYTLGYLTVLLTQRVNTALSPALPALILGLPIMDILAVLYLRARHGENLFRATKNHVHHRLLMLGFDHYTAVIVIYSIQALFVISAVFMRYQSDLSIIALYLGTCGALFAGLTLAERWGMRVGPGAHPGRLSLLVFRLKAHQHLSTVPTLVLATLFPLYLVGASVLIDPVPADFAYGAFGLFAVLVLSLSFRQRPQAPQHRVAVYVAVAFVVYLASESSWAHLPAVELFDGVFYAVIAIALALAIRYTSDDVFRLTPMDYLVALGVLLVGAANGGDLAGSVVPAMLIKIIVLFYAAEWLINGAERRWNGLFLGVMGALLTLGVRGLLW